MSSLYLESLISREKKETSQQLPLVMIDHQGNLQQSASGKKVQGKIIWKSRKRGSHIRDQNEVPPPDAVEEPESSVVPESNAARNYLYLSFRLSESEFIPFQRATIIHYCHFLLYQCGFTPLPFHQLEEVVENEIINTVDEESRSQSFKSLQKQRKILQFVSQLQDAFSGIDRFLSLSSSEPKNDSILPILKFGVGIGPSMNNLKKIFFLNFRTNTSHNNSSYRLPEMNVPKKTSDKWKRMLLHKLIEFQSSNDGCFSVGSSSSSASSSSTAAKNGNIYLFFQVASAELLSSSSSSSTDSTELLQNDLLKFFSFSHSVPFSSHFVQPSSEREEQSSVSSENSLTHREKQIQKKLFHLNIELETGSSSEKLMEFSDNDNGAAGDEHSGGGEGGWFVLRKGIKVLKVSL
jgi:hypothetical protein